MPDPEQTQAQSVATRPAASMELVPAKPSSMLPGVFEPQSLKELMDFSEWLVKHHVDILPKDYRSSAGNIAVAAMMGRDIGLPLMQALQSIAVINGRGAIFGDALAAVIYGQPDLEVYEEFDFEEIAKQQKAQCTIKRKGRSTVKRTFSVDDAKKANLWTKEGPWSNYPYRMLMMRARAFAARDAYPDRLKGIRIYEEVQDYETVETTARVVPPEPKELTHVQGDVPAGNTEHVSSEGAAQPAPTEDVARVEPDAKPSAPAEAKPNEAPAQGSLLSSDTGAAADQLDRLINDAELREVVSASRAKYGKDDQPLRDLLKRFNYVSLRHIKLKDHAAILAELKQPAQGKSF